MKILRFITISILITCLFSCKKHIVQNQNLKNNKLSIDIISTADSTKVAVNYSIDSTGKFIKN